jgi:hypothetical protein
MYLKRGHFANALLCGRWSGGALRTYCVTGFSEKYFRQLSNWRSFFYGLDKTCRTGIFSLAIAMIYSII